MISSTQRKKLEFLLYTLSSPEEIRLELEKKILEETKKPEPVSLDPKFSILASQIQSLQVKLSKLLEERPKKEDEPKDNRLEEIMSEIQMLRRMQTGASMYQAWQEDSTTNGTLAGAVDAVNTSYTLRAIPKPSSLHLYWNGILQTNDTDYSLVIRSITTLFVPDSNNIITAKYAI